MPFIFSSFLLSLDTPSMFRRSQSFNVWFISQSLYNAWNRENIILMKDKRGRNWSVADNV